MTIAPSTGIVQAANGGSALGYGVIVSHFVPESKTSDLEKATDEFSNAVRNGQVDATLQDVPAAHFYRDRFPTLELASARSVVEVGSEEGTFTQVLAAWHAAVARDSLFDGDSFNLDFHSVP